MTSEADILSALRNSGIDTDCGACMEVAFTGVTTNRHTCRKNNRTEELPIASELFQQLRTDLGHVIVNRFKRTYDVHGIDYDPDTCYEAADDVLACVLAAALTALGSPIPVRSSTVKE